MNFSSQNNKPLAMMFFILISTNICLKIQSYFMFSY